MIASSPFKFAAQYREECVSSTLGEMLPDYVVGLLEDSASAEVEDHLLDCLHCRELYLKMLRVQSRRPQAESATAFDSSRTPSVSPAPRGANVISIADFKKRRR